MSRAPALASLRPCRGAGSLLRLAAVAVAEALLELLDAAFGVDEALLAGEERVVARPDVYVQLGLRAVGLHDDLAVADDLRLDHLRVDALLHLRRSLSRPASARGASSVLSGGPLGKLERRPRGAARRMLAHAGATSRSAGGRGAGGRAGPGP